MATTLTYYKRWKAGHFALYGGKYLIPCVPAAVITGVNWDEWFVNAGASLPFGFASLLIAVIATIVAISSKDKILEKKVSPLFTIALVMAIWAISFMFLANIFQQIGQMLLWTVAGIVGGGIADQVDKSLITERVNEYKELIEENSLNKSSKKREERRQKAKEEARKEAEAHQATE